MGRGVHPAVAAAVHGPDEDRLTPPLQPPGHFPHTREDRRTTGIPEGHPLLQVRNRHAARLARTAASLTAAGAIALGVAAVPAAADTATATAVPTVQQAETDAAQFEERILELLNADRQEMGLAPLERLDVLDDIAQGWSEQQARDGLMAHNPDYFAQYPGTPRAGGENVAYGYRTPEQMYQGWFNSPGHHRNMFNPTFTHIGIGIAFDESGAPYGTQNFAAFF